MTAPWVKATTKAASSRTAVTVRARPLPPGSSDTASTGHLPASQEEREDIDDLGQVTLTSLVTIGN